MGWLPAADIPSGRGDGAHVNTLVSSGSHDIVWMASGDPQRRLLMNSSAGLGFLCRLGDLATKTRQGKDFMKVDEGAQAQKPALDENAATLQQKVQRRPAISAARFLRLMPETTSD